MANKRVLCRIKKRLTVHFGIDEAVRVAFTEDLSISGMFIKTPNVVPPGSNIIISFLLDDAIKIELNARVMWAKKVPPNLFHLIKKSGMGVKFLHFNAGADAFKSFFASVAPSL